MKRFKMWSSLSFGFMVAIAIVAGCTRTISVTPTLPITLITVTPTNTAVASAVPTSTPETVQVNPGAAAPPNSTQIAGASVIPVLQFSATNSGNGTATMTSLQLTASGTGNDTTAGINTVSLYLDTNGNGIVDGGDTLLITGTYTTDNGVLTLNFSAPIPPTSSVTILVVYTFSPTAPSGTYQANLTSLTGTNGLSGSPVVIAGLPSSGAVITIAGATPTATNSPTNSPTPTLIPGGNTFTATNSPTNSPTKTLTNSPTVTATNSTTNTPTITPLVANTATSTATPCQASSVQPSYNFDASLSCWHVDQSPLEPQVAALDISTTTTHTGAGSLHATVVQPASPGNVQLELDFSTPVDLSAVTSISAWVYVDASLVGSSVQLFQQSNPYIWDSGAWFTFDAGHVGQWVQVTWAPPTFGGGGSPTQVNRIGVQFYGFTGSTSGNIYVDDVTITSAGVTPTPTATSSPTTTPTNTPTVTPSGSCPLPVAASYTFDTNINCWSTVNVQGSSSVAWTNTPPAGSISGGGALQGTVTYPDTTAGAADEDFEVALPPGTDLTGKIITFNVYVPTGIGGTTYGGMQPYIKYGSALTFCDQTWIGNPGLGAWHTYSINLSNTCTAGANDVRAFGIQVFVGGGASGTGNIYIDDVTITTAAPPTATPTPSGYGWTYEDTTPQQWAIVNGTSGTGDTAAVTALAALNAGASGTNGSNYGLDIIFPAVAVLDNTNNDFQAECNSTAGSPIIGTSMDWSALNLTSVTVQFWISPNTGAYGIGNYASTLYPYIRAGGGAISYGGTYGGWANQCGAPIGPGCNYLASNTWQTVTLTPSGGTWTANETDVLAVGVDINVSGVTPFHGGDYVIDNITLQ